MLRITSLLTLTVNMDPRPWTALTVTHMHMDTHTLTTKCTSTEHNFKTWNNLTHGRELDLVQSGKKKKKKSQKLQQNLRLMPHRKICLAVHTDQQRNNSAPTHTYQYTVVVVCTCIHTHLEAMHQQQHTRHCVAICIDDATHHVVTRHTTHPRRQWHVTLHMIDGRSDNCSHHLVDGSRRQE
jgi:hypothetical protein